jgi:hypothetical protein
MSAYLRSKMHIKRYFIIRVKVWVFGVFWVNMAVIWKYLFFRCILSLSYIFEIYVKFCLFSCMTRLGLNKFFSTFIRCLTESSWPFRKLTVTSKFFYACFRYFYIKMNRFQGYSHSKSKFDPPYCKVVLQVHVGTIWRLHRRMEWIRLYYIHNVLVLMCVIFWPFMSRLQELNKNGKGELFFL